MLRSANTFISLFALLCTACIFSPHSNSKPQDRPDSKPPTCHNFLKAIGKQQPFMAYTGCEHVGGQLDSYEATYEIAGKDALEAEAYLTQYANHPKLNFACCGWEPEKGGYGEFPSGYEFPFHLTMFSEETLINKREKWGNITKFTLIVELYTKSP